MFGKSRPDSAINVKPHYTLKTPLVFWESEIPRIMDLNQPTSKNLIDSQPTFTVWPTRISQSSPRKNKMNTEKDEQKFAKRRSTGFIERFRKIYNLRN